MDIAERDRAAYALAREYLLGFSAVGVTEAVLGHYIYPSVAALRPCTLADVYQRLLVSAQNRGMSAGVIGGAIDGIEKLKGILRDFEPRNVVREYGQGWNVSWMRSRPSCTQGARSDERRGVSGPCSAGRSPPALAFSHSLIVLIPSTNGWKPLIPM